MLRKMQHLDISRVQHYSPIYSSTLPTFLLRTAGLQTVMDYKPIGCQNLGRERDHKFLRDNQTTFVSQRNDLFFMLIYPVTVKAALYSTILTDQTNLLEPLFLKVYKTAISLFKNVVRFANYLLNIQPKIV